MIIINGKEINEYKDYRQLNGNDILTFMKNQSVEDIAEFKTFAQTKKVIKYTDGSELTRGPNFFELRNWVLEKYAPGITEPRCKKVVRKKFIDAILDL